MALALTDREQRVALILAVVGVVVFALIRVSLVWVVLGVILATAIGLSAAQRRRVPTAVSAFVCGLGPWWDGFIVFGAAYLILAFVLVRAGRQVPNGPDRGGTRR